MSWHSIRAYYHADQDALILNAVRPLLDHIAADVSAAYFVRHWMRGPHVRVHVECPADLFDEKVWPAARRIVGDYLSAHPSTMKIDPQTQLAMHRRLAELEQETEPVWPWLPDNTLRPAPVDRRIQVLGSDDAAELLTDFYVTTNELTYKLLEAVAAGTQRLSPAFTMMIATAHELSGIGITRGFVSFRSHAEAFLSGFPEGRGLRPAWDAHYQRHSAQLVAQVRDIVDHLDAGRDDLATHWVRTLQPFRERGEKLIAEGRIPMGIPGDNAAGGVTGLWEVSPFHQALATAPSWERVKGSDWFAVYRLLLNYTYLAMTRLGIAPVERFLLCHLAANAVEDGFGVSALTEVSS